MDRLNELETAAVDLEMPPLGEEADWLGRLDRVIRELREIRADVIAELDGPVTGKEYRVTESRAADRTYNTAALLSTFGRAGWELRDILDSGAARLTWRWTELRRALATAGQPLLVAAREVSDEGDLDEPMVGEVWRSQYKVEGLK